MMFSYISPNDVIDMDEFRSACCEADVDSDSLSQRDLESLQGKLK